MSQQHLTSEQQASWNLLLTEIRKRNAQNNLELMQAIMRWFAIEIARKQTDKTSISIQRQGKWGSLRSFSTAAHKEDYLALHSQDGVWGEDALMFAAFEALGYQVKLKLTNTDIQDSYLAVENSHSGLEARIVNHGARNGGVHWEMEGEANPGAGNCMYYAMAQVVQKDLVKVASLLASVVKTSPVAIHTALQQQAIPAPIPQLVRQPAIVPSHQALPASLKKCEEKNSHQVIDASVREEQAVVKTESVRVASMAAIQDPAYKHEQVEKHIIDQFKKLDKSADERYRDATQILKKYSAAELIRIYHFVIKNRMDHDTYLTNRPKYIVEELQEMGWQGSKEDLLKEKFGLEAEVFEPIIHEQLVHMLAKEVWRAANLYPLLEKLPKLMHAETSRCHDDAIDFSEQVIYRPIAGC